MGCVQTNSQNKQSKYQERNEQFSISLAKCNKGTIFNQSPSKDKTQDNSECRSEKRINMKQLSIISQSNAASKLNQIETRANIKSQKSFISNSVEKQIQAKIKVKKSAENYIITKQNIDIEKLYDMHEIIGEGSNGKVYKAIQLSTGKTVAVKKIKNTQKNKTQFDKILSEIKILKKINHPNLIKTLDVILNQNFTYIVTEYYTGTTLNKVIEKSQQFSVYFSEDEISKILKQILSALAYLHEKQIIHRDIKPENIIFANNEYDQVKIIDFGFACYKNELHQSNQILGTPYYISPEIITEDKTQDQKSDVWSLGVVLYEMLTNVKPIQGESMEQLFTNIIESTINFNYELLNQYSNKLVSLLKKMLNKNFQQRISARDALSTEFFNDQKKQSIRKKVILNFLESVQSKIEYNYLQQVLINYINHSIVDYDYVYHKKIIQTYQALESKNANMICKQKLKKAIKFALSDQKNEEDNGFLLKQIQADSTILNFQNFTTKTLNFAKFLNVENISKCFKMLDFEHKQRLSSSYILTFFKQNIKSKQLQNNEEFLSIKQQSILSQEYLVVEDFINLFF